MEEIVPNASSYGVPADYSVASSSYSNSHGMTLDSANSNSYLASYSTNYSYISTCFSTVGEETELVLPQDLNQSDAYCPEDAANCFFTEEETALPTKLVQPTDDVEQPTHNNYSHDANADPIIVEGVPIDVPDDSSQFNKSSFNCSKWAMMILCFLLVLIVTLAINLNGGDKGTQTNSSLESQGKGGLGPTVAPSRAESSAAKQSSTTDAPPNTPMTPPMKVEVNVVTSAPTSQPSGAKAKPIVSPVKFPPTFSPTETPFASVPGPTDSPHTASKPTPLPTYPPTSSPHASADEPTPLPTYPPTSSPHASTAPPFSPDPLTSHLADMEFGSSVSLSAYGTILTVGSKDNLIQTYSYDGTSWLPQGNALLGGSHVVLSGNGLVMVENSLIRNFKIDFRFWN